MVDNGRFREIPLYHKYNNHNKNLLQHYNTDCEWLRPVVEFLLMRNLCDFLEKKTSTDVGEPYYRELNS